MSGGPHGIESPRLVLRPVEAPEAPDVHALLTDEDVRRYLMDGAVASREWVEGIIRDSAASFAARGLGIWVARERGAPAIVGLAGFRDFYRPPVLELFYALLPSRWHRGLGTEMARAAIDHAFTRAGLSEVRASTDEPNAASIRVLGRLGLRPSGRTAKEDVGTVLWDQLHFAVSREQWVGRR